MDSAELTDVGATVLNGQVLISWVATDNQPSFAVSNNGVSFGPRVVPADSSLGIGNQGPDTAFVPALTSNGTTAYVATVGANQLVYMSYTTNGSSFSPLIANGVSVSAYQTTSRPSLTMYNGHPWVAFTDVSPRQAVIGDATGTNAPVVDTNVYWGNSHRNSNYAGISLLNYGGLLWAFGQDTASSQYLKYIDSNGGSTWSGASFQGPWFQMRWTPSLTALTVGPAIYAYLAYQDDANTNISYSHN